MEGLPLDSPDPQKNFIEEAVDLSLGDAKYYANEKEYERALSESASGTQPPKDSSTPILKMHAGKSRSKLRSVDDEIYHQQEKQTEYMAPCAKMSVSAPRPSQVH